MNMQRHLAAGDRISQTGALEGCGGITLTPGGSFEMVNTCPTSCCSNSIYGFLSYYYMFSGLPMCPELTRDHIPKARDAGHFLSVTGTVIRTSVTKVLEYERDYMCNKCRHVFSVQAAFEQFYTFTPPTSCPNEEGCNSFKFTCLSGSDAPPAACKDYQEIKIQEQVRWCIFMYSHPGATRC